MISSILSQMLILLGILTIGYFAGRRGIIDSRVKRGLSDIALKAALPCSLLASSNMKLTPQSLRSVWLMVLIALAYYLIAIVLFSAIATRLKVSADRKKLFILIIVFANTGFIGFPVIAAFDPIHGIFYAGIFNIMYNLFQFTFGVWLLSGGGKPRVSNFLLNPTTMASIGMLGIFLLQVKFPLVLQRFLSTVGGTVSPLVLLIMGFMLTEISFREIFRERVYYLISACRLVLCPVAMAIALKMLGIDQAVATVGVVMCALPSGSLNAILADQYECDPAFASKAVIQTLALSFVTMPGAAFLIKALS